MLTSFLLLTTAGGPAAGGFCAGAAAVRPAHLATAQPQLNAQLGRHAAACAARAAVAPATGGVEWLGAAQHNSSV